MIRNKRKRRRKKRNPNRRVGSGLQGSGTTTEGVSRGVTVVFKGIMGAVEASNARTVEGATNETTVAEEVFRGIDFINDIVINLNF